VSGSKKTKKRGDHAEHDPAAKSAPAETAAPADPLRCVIVEDQRMFSQLLVTMLRAGPGLDLEIAATAETVAEGIAACEAHAPELLILDLALADGRGEAVAERLLEHNPGAKVIVLSAHAATFVCPPALTDAIHAVVDKADAFDALQIVLGKLTSPAPANPSARDRLAEQLSHREQEVLLLVGQGLQSKQIAERLQISHNTVQSHRKKIAFKLGTEGMELTRYAYHYWQRVAAGGCDSPA
jgi:DNA-binding NarL/FixJ family response regulator